MRTPSRPTRLLLFAWVVVALWFVAMLWNSGRTTGTGRAQFGGIPLGGDFIIFYTGSTLLRQGTPLEVYEPEHFHLAEQAITGTLFGRTPWVYPPPALLLVAPLGWLPYLASLALWLLCGVASYVWVLRRLAPGELTTLWALGSTGVVVNLVTGQSGLLATALLGTALMSLERRPVLSGLLIGVLCVKPQLALAALVALAAGRHLRTLGVALATLSGLVLASLACFGLGAWQSFLQILPEPLAWLDAGKLDPTRLPSVFGALRLLGTPTQLASILQGLVTVAALGLLWQVWSRRGGLGPRIAALACCVGLSTPYIFDYDLALVALAIGGLLSLPEGEGPPPPDALLGALWALPLLSTAMAKLVGVQLGPLVLTWGLFHAWRASFGSSTTRAGDA